MPSLRMKSKSSMGSLRDNHCLGVCQKSSMIAKKPCSHITACQQATDLNSCIDKTQDGYGKQLNLKNAVPSSVQICTLGIEFTEPVEQQDISDSDNSQFQKQLSTFVDSGTVERVESTDSSTSDLETIFSPVVEPVEVYIAPDIDDDIGSNNDLSILRLGGNDTADNQNPCDYQTCNVSDFSISDMIIAGIPFDSNAVNDDITEANPFSDYKCGEPGVLFDVAEEYMMLPFLEDTVKVSNFNDMKSCEGDLVDPDNGSLYLAINQISSCDQDSDPNTDSDQNGDFDQFFIKNLPQLTDFRPESRSRKSVTLVLDLDETLVHSTLEHCDDADFTFNVFFNMKEHTVYVKRRPHLHTFLEKVADMFEVVIFTASQSIYASQLLDILDPEGKFISRRAYRESCVFSDEGYTKDLTVLGVDLAKIAIIDNSPQVFRLQINNGIPIKSWFSDPSDCALISLLPFLETLVDADDVRPIIAKRFGNKE